MNYQSFLSSLLQTKYYTECKYVPKLEDIAELSLTIQRNSRLKIQSRKPTQDQIFLHCPLKDKIGCPFSHLFKKVNSSKDLQKYELIQSNQTHLINCQEARKQKKSLQSRSSQQDNSKQLSMIQSSELTEQIETLASSPVSKESIMNLTKSQSCKTQSVFKKIYSENQLALLKKQLEKESKGLLSRSSEFEPYPLNHIAKKIKFHCKFQESCPYEAILTATEAPGKVKLYHETRYYILQITNPNHLPQCILEDQTTKYNQNTMRIDKEMDLLTKIIQENSEDLKPRDILRKLALELGEQEDFIYEGLQKKINKRAIKKYFDNCVAKVRNKIFSPRKTNPKTSFSLSESNSKKDEDYFCKFN